MKRIVITGGTYAGKSSIVELFKQDGFSVVPDVGFEIIGQLNTSLGQEAQKELRREHAAEFYSMIIEKQLEYEKEIRETTVFDRGVYDYIAMMELKNITVPSSLRRLAETAFYDSVFVLDTLADFDMRPDSGRSLTKEDSSRLRELVTEIYTKLGSKVVGVKEMDLQDRYAYIRRYI
jgi:predicted ATPase